MSNLLESKVLHNGFIYVLICHDHVCDISYAVGYYTSRDKAETARKSRASNELGYTLEVKEEFVQ